MDNGRRTVTVTELNEYLKMALESDEMLAGIYVKGEISNFTNHRSGHLYFTLKDEGGCLFSVMFRSSAAKLKFLPENGMKVICGGRISVFVKSGQYQLYVETMEPDGVGSLYIAYEQLKKKLEAEGLFAEARKKALPKIPTKIGVITSPTGAAVRDIINITGRRFPYAKILIYPSLVQGDGAAQNMIAALDYFDASRSVDVIIIGRGGGSIEDLWAFNDEALVRRVAAMTIPTISAVGHETDFTLCDFAADKRAPTPSAAAETAVPDTRELTQKFENVSRKMELIETQQIKIYRERLARLSQSRALTNQEAVINDKRLALDVLESALFDKMKNAAESKKARLAAICAKLEALNPMSVISRGYSAVFGKDKTLIKSADQVSVGDEISLRLSDGTIGATVKNIDRSEKNG
ncbi:MAG: exodeoxyribonuclease VII large subunit [Clostridia bacterium]|nr:exodeoxyribonuclease VII large subunit [Clostridia bacterium]